jgi:hypothetical protein
LGSQHFSNAVKYVSEITLIRFLGTRVGNRTRWQSRWAWRRTSGWRPSWRKWFCRRRSWRRQQRRLSSPLFIIPLQVLFWRIIIPVLIIITAVITTIIVTTVIINTVIRRWWSGGSYNVKTTGI